MYKILFLLSLLLSLSGCAQQTRGFALAPHSSPTISPYSLEALELRYIQKD